MMKLMLFEVWGFEGFKILENYAVTKNYVGKKCFLFLRSK